MITPSPTLIASVEAETRNPTAYLGIDWNMQVASGQWSDIEAYEFTDESDNIMTIEGYSEMVGDSNQYSISDFDCVLNNSLNRYTPRSNKNLIKNPSFEKNLLYWNTSII